MKRLLSWFRGPLPESLLTLARKRRKPGLDRLYVLSVDFPVSAKERENIERTLDTLRNKYGIDFFVLEPGIKLSRFDEI